MTASDPVYLAKAALVVQVLPFLASESAFALKGGTAINLLWRDMPRLSVDVDLTFLPLVERKAALAEMDAALKRLAVLLRGVSPGYAARVASRQEGAATSLLVANHEAEIKVEVNTVLRGSVQPAAKRVLVPSASRKFGFAEVNALSFEDTYAGKLVAALDRQHPRDLFDVSLLLANEGLSEELLDSFVVYLASHGRPMSEVLLPREKDVGDTYNKEFAGMPFSPVTLDSLYAARSQLGGMLRRQLGARRLAFLRSVKAIEPDWSLMPVPHLPKLPGLRWKLHNLERLRREQPGKYAEALANLDRALEKLS
jgi:predicted nucleotidyltransferase component of viral defense system